MGVGVVVVVADPGGGAGVEVLRIATGGLPFFPRRMNRAGCFFVAPPTGTIDSARWVPGAMWTGATCGLGRATATGEDTSFTKPAIVPRSLALIGWY